MISIRYKALVPMGLLAGVLLALIVTAAVALSESMSLNQSLASRYREIEEVRQIEVGVNNLVTPFISFLESGAREHQEAATQILDDLDDRVRDLRAMAVVNDEEREVLEFVEEQLAEIRKHSGEYFRTSIHDHGALMASLHEITREHFTALGEKLRDYHDDELKQVDQLVLQSEQLQAMFQRAVFGAALVTLALFALAIWISNRVIVQPILSISKSTAGIADGQLEQHVAVISDDELGRLSSDINRMAQSLQTMYKRMDQLAHTDSLTGLMNRRAFEQIAERELDAARRYGRKFGLVMIDIDYFKQINDTYGHSIGDEVLRFVARTSAMTLRASDTCFRIGGEEFVLLLQEADGDQVMSIAERCRRVLADSPWADADHTIPVTASFGVACAPRDGNTLEQLLKSADAALYEAKKDGRNRVAGTCCNAASAAG